MFYLCVNMWLSLNVWFRYLWGYVVRNGASSAICVFIIVVIVSMVVFVFVFFISSINNLGSINNMFIFIDILRENIMFFVIYFLCWNNVVALYVNVIATSSLNILSIKILCMCFDRYNNVYVYGGIILYIVYIENISVWCVVYINAKTICVVVTSRVFVSRLSLFIKLYSVLYVYMNLVGYIKGLVLFFSLV